MIMDAETKYYLYRYHKAKQKLEDVLEELDGIINDIAVSDARSLAVEKRQEIADILERAKLELF